MKILDWANKYRVFAIIVILWLMWLMSYVTIIGFTEPPAMNGAVSTVLVTIWGIPAVIVGLIKWRSKQIGSHDDKTSGK